MTSNRSPSPTPSERDDSSDIDELDYRSRKLTKILKKNVNRADKRKTVLDVVRDKAWLLEDQVKLLEKQTSKVSRSLARQNCWRRVLVALAVIVSLFLVVNTAIFTEIYHILSYIIHKIFGGGRTQQQHDVS